MSAGSVIRSGVTLALCVSARPNESVFSRVTRQEKPDILHRGIPETRLRVARVVGRGQTKSSVFAVHEDAVLLRADAIDELG
jgi:hypothetical protein